VGGPTLKPELLFGTAGVPLASKKRDPASGVEAVAALGLGAMELEFVYGVRITDEMAERVRQAAEHHGISLTCHGPYYINLNAQERDKLQASVERILATARAARKVGARSVTFHAAFYMKQDPEKVHSIVRDQLTRIVDELRSEGNPVHIRPELTGKPSQYGDLEELLALASEIEGVFPCIDFSHLHARTGGAENTYEEFRRVLGRYAEVLGKQSLRDLHLHVSGIAYTHKGERKHLELKQSDFRYRELLRALKQSGAGGVLICESPNLERDALLLKRSYQRLKTGKR
jgi:deoxyribonuclease-4